MSRERRRHRNESDTLAWPDRLIEAGALFLLVFTPLAYGTVEPWSEAIAELVVLSVAVTWVAGMVLRHWELRIELPPGWLPASLFLTVVIFQLVPLPADLAGIVSPLAVGLHQTAATHTGTTVSLVPVSLDPHATWREGLKLLSVAALFLVLYNTYRTRRQVRRALWTMVGMGTLLSVFGVVQRMTWNGRFYWIGPEAPHAQAFGPFVNRAHFAGLMVIVVPMALAMVLGTRRDSGQKHHSRGWRDRLRRWNSGEAGPTRLVPFLVLLMGGAALVSGSRGGMVALLAALLAMVGLAALGRSRKRLVPVALAGGLIVLAGLWIGSDILEGTAERLAKEVVEEVEGTRESPRLHIWADALGLWREAPVIGSGLATFGVTFPRVRTIEAPVTYTHAESDWVQLLTDTGALGLALALCAAGALGLTLLRHRRHAASPWARSLALAGLVALIGSAIQSVGNFNLPVMSNLVTLAFAFAIAFRTGINVETRPKPSPAAS